MSLTPFRFYDWVYEPVSIRLAPRAALIIFFSSFLSIYLAIVSSLLYFYLFLSLTLSLSLSIYIYIYIFTYVSLSCLGIIQISIITEVIINKIRWWGQSNDRCMTWFLSFILSVYFFSLFFLILILYFMIVKFIERNYALIRGRGDSIWMTRQRRAVNQWGENRQLAEPSSSSGHYCNSF